MTDTIYDRIKSLRQAKGYSQEQLAKMVGYADKTSIARIEAGKIDLPQSKIVAFSNALDTTVSYLLDGNNTENEYYLDDESKEAAQFLFDNPEYKVLFDASKKVKKEDIDFVKKMIDKFSE